MLARMSLSRDISDIFCPIHLQRNMIPLYTCPVSAGFPSPSDDYLEAKLDLNQHLIKHPVATFFVRVSGDSMINAGIHDGDLLVVDRSLDPQDGRVIVAVVNGEMLVKRLRMKLQQIYLVAENPSYPSLLITEAMDFQVWGVVTNVVHAL
jgi:DNA polymerase V